MVSPNTEVEITDPETETTMTHWADIHLGCTECGHTWPYLELGVGDLTAPCEECSTPGTPDTRTPAKLALTLKADVFADVDPEAVDSMESVIDRAESWVRRIEHLTSEQSWELDFVEDIGDNPKQFHLHRDVTPDDELDYETLQEWETKYQDELQALQTGA